MNQFRILFLMLFLGLSVSVMAQTGRARTDLRNAQQSARTGDYDRAMDQVQSALRRSPEFMEAWVFKAELHIMRGEDEQGVHAFRQAMANEGPSGVLFRWGRLALQMGNYTMADSVLAVYETALDAPATYREEASKMRGNAQFALNLMANPVPFDPESLGESVNRLEMQYFPSITGDGNTLVFTARNLTTPPLDEDFYVTEKSEGTWSDAERLTGFLNTEGNEGAQSVSADGEIIFYAGCNRPEGRGSCDIYMSYKSRDGSWSEPINLGDSVNSRFWDTQPSISADGKTLFFVRAGSSMEENSDIYYSQWTGRHWTRARRIPGAVNTRMTESSPFIHFDGKSLYFSSNGHSGMGSLDLFVSRLGEDGRWGEPENLGYPINTFEREFSLIVAPDGRTAYYSSDRGREVDHLELYSFQLPEKVRATPVAWVQAVVLDDATGQPVSAKVQVVDVLSNKSLVQTQSNRNGVFSTSLPARSNYALNVSKPGYMMYSEGFRLENQTEASAEVIEVRLRKLQVGERVVLENVFFDTDSYQLKPESEAELNQLAVFLESNPTVRLSIDGHTDNQGSANYNLELSKNRASAVRDYLITQGVERSRLETQGFGDTKPIADNSTEEGRALNRRTEARILGL